MSEILKKLDNAELENITGGNAGLYYNEGWRTVAGTAGGKTSIYSAPYSDPSNAVSGSDLSDGDRVQIAGASAEGKDGNTYVWVFSPRTGISGYVNSAYLV